MTRWRTTVIVMIRCLLILLVLLLMGCRETAAPAKPAFILGPGCTIHYEFVGPDGTPFSESLHYDRCPLVVWDSLRVTPENAP